MIEEIVSFAAHLTPLALIGAGGIGKTSVALTVLHDDRIKKRFGNERRFIRCDQFPTSLIHFLRRLSTVVGASIQGPEYLAPLRPFLSSKEMLIVLDNAESILDPQAPNAREIYSVIEELSELSNICLCITSRISTLPYNCKTLEVPTLSAEAARDTFYRIYQHGKQSDSVNNILEKLDFHPLSITLLATVAHQNKWSVDRLAREWEDRRTGVLETKHRTSLAATIELSLSSPTFQELGLNAQGLLGVIAFYPQGVDEKNLRRLFPTIPNTADIFDSFCILSLTYRSEGFVKMLAPLRDHLSPNDPLSSPLHYLARLSVPFDVHTPSFGETRWIFSEDVNIEHLLDVFTSLDPTSDDLWNACTNFISRLIWHKPRLLVLATKIEELPDDYHLKPVCLFGLSRLFGSVGNYLECKRLLARTLKLWRDWGNQYWVARTLMSLSNVNSQLNLCEEGIQQAEEALEIYEQHEDTVRQARCMAQLAQLLFQDRQLDAAEETASRAITLLPENNEQLTVYRSHDVLGDVYRLNGNKEKAVKHFNVALGIASSHGWHEETFGIHRSLVEMFSDEGNLNDANSHLELAKACAANNKLKLAHAVELQAYVSHRGGRLEEAESEYLRARSAFEKLGASIDAKDCQGRVDMIRAEMKSLSALDEISLNGEHCASGNAVTMHIDPRSDTDQNAICNPKTRQILQMILSSRCDPGSSLLRSAPICM